MALCFALVSLLTEIDRLVKVWKGKWPSAGDRITYGKYAGQKIIIDGVKLLILNDDEITSVLPASANVTAYLE
jgi:hypothetical protein